jgi:hypothetical protein
MARKLGLALGLLVTLSAAGDARAQFGYGYYPYGYGGWGWVGWGGSTVQGSIARGLGAFNVGAGIYNEQTAVANSINADTVMRWNEYWYEAQQQANRREYLRMARRMQRDAASGDAIYQRLRDNPSPEDIADGNALNVLLDQLSDPRIHSSAIRLATDTIPARYVHAIPFVNASEAVTLSLNELTGEEDWPFALKGERFAADRNAYADAVRKALEEDREGDLKAETIQAVRDALARLRAKLDANPPDDPAQRGEAYNFIRTHVAMTRMLERPDVEKIVAELDKTKDTSLNHLLAFMHTFNLRFGRATTTEQRSAYGALYPIMVAHRDRVMKGLAPGKGATAKANTNANQAPPPEFLRPMKPEELEGVPPKLGDVKSNK